MTLFQRASCAVLKTHPFISKRDVGVKLSTLFDQAEKWNKFAKDMEDTEMELIPLGPEQ
jgi:hypothetical protein